MATVSSILCLIGCVLECVLIVMLVNRNNELTERDIRNGTTILKIALDITAINEQIKRDKENKDYKDIAYKMAELIEDKYMQKFVINWETKDVKLVDKK